MFTRMISESGVLTYSDAMLQQLVQKAFEPYKNQCWPGKFIAGSQDVPRSGRLDAPGVLSAEVTESGVLLCICVVMRFGVPIRQTLEKIIRTLSASITDCLEMPVDNIILEVTAVAAKGVSARAISLDSHGTFVNYRD